MSSSMGSIVGHDPNNTGTQSFYHNITLQRLEQHEREPTQPDETVEGSKDIVVELHVGPGKVEEVTNTNLTPFAKAYLINRHGTLDLEPMPSACDADPYNWPRGKKATVLLLVAFHCLVATLNMTALIPAYAELASEFGVTVHDCTYLTLVQILMLGVAPLVWGPLATVYGRRPVFLGSLVMSTIGNVGCGLSQNYGAMIIFRLFVALFLSPANAFSSSVVTDMFLKTERARCIGICLVMFSLGVPFGPLLFGFVNSFRWIFWALAIINGVQFVLHFFLGYETLYVHIHSPPTSVFEEKTNGFRIKFLTLAPVGSRRISKVDFLEPLAMAACPCAVFPALAQSIVFLFGSIFITVEIPVQLGGKFHLNTEQVGLQFLGMVIGSSLAEPVGGLLSDVCMGLRKMTQEGYTSPPELRLWLSYAGYCLVLIGVPLFLVTTEHAEDGEWTVVPVVGMAIAAGGNQIALTTLATYAVDCATEDAMNVGILTTFLRQLIAFIGPLWFPTMIDRVGLKWCTPIIYSLIVVLSILPTVLLQIRGKHWR